MRYGTDEPIILQTGYVVDENTKMHTSNITDNTTGWVT